MSDGPYKVPHPQSDEHVHYQAGWYGGHAAALSSQSERVRELEGHISAIVEAWKEDEIGQIDGKLIDDAQAALAKGAKP